MIYCNNCGKLVIVTNADCGCLMTLTAEQLDKLRQMWENDCPTYQPTHDTGYEIGPKCWFCNMIQNNREPNHYSFCPWLTLEELFE